MEIDIANGLPAFTIVGLPDSSVRESAERVRSAIKNSGGTFPLARITVNLAPADVRKEGASFDLAIAVGLLSASGQLSIPQMESCLVIGELSLDGRLRPVPGVLSMVDSAKRKGLKQVLLPSENVDEARLIAGMRLIGIDSLKQLLIPGSEQLFRNALLSAGLKDESAGGSPFRSDVDFADVRGHFQAKRALAIAASGMHSFLFTGPPGSGKTMLIRRLPSILPPLTDEESLEVTKIYSSAGLIRERSGLVRERPFRSPHHTVSGGGLVGAGTVPKPGEISLAHRGVLFLDEIAEFPRHVLDLLRQPLEDRFVTISRARTTVTFPTHFMLAASMNPCPCGYYGFPSAAQACTCSPLKVRQYRARLSGPILDRIDMQVEVPRIDYGSLGKEAETGGSSEEMRKAVETAMRIQSDRYAGTGIRFNGELSGRLLRDVCRLKPEAERLMAASFAALGLSARAHDRILKIARTIADLEQSESIEAPHLAEALQYRSFERRIEA